MNISLPPATIRLLAALTFNTSGAAAGGGPEAEAEAPGCGEAGAEGCAPPGACDLPRARPLPAGLVLAVADPEWCESGTPANPSAPYATCCSGAGSASL